MHRLSNPLSLAGVALVAIAAAPAFAGTPSNLNISLEANAAANTGAWSSQPITTPTAAPSLNELAPTARDFVSVPAMLQRPLSRVASAVVLALADGSGVSLSLTRVGQLDCILWPVASSPMTFAQFTPVQLEAAPESVGPLAVNEPRDEVGLGRLLD